MFASFAFSFKRVVNGVSEFVGCVHDASQAEDENLVYVYLGVCAFLKLLSNQPLKSTDIYFTFTYDQEKQQILTKMRGKLL